jgi:hypothetical protein
MSTFSLAKIVIAAVAAALLTACDKPPPAVEKAPIPSVYSWLDLSANEFQEIERRCLGVSHPTCDALSKGRSDREKYAKNKKELDSAFDKVFKAQDELIYGRK